jgi:hypothetical protein
MIEMIYFIEISSVEREQIQNQQKKFDKMKLLSKRSFCFLKFYIN